MPPVPPVAARKPRHFTHHGDRRRDDYFWLRDKGTPAVTAHLEAENAYTEAMMKPSRALQKTLYREMLGRIKETDMGVPYREGEFWYYSRTQEGKCLQLLCLES